MTKCIGLVLTVCLSVLIFSSCGGGGTSSGTSLNLTGTWRLYPHITSSIIVVVPSTVVVQQSGNAVVSTSFVEDSNPGTVLCSTDMPLLSGTTSGNTLNGIITTSVSNTTFSVSGNSSSLSGTFQINYHSGICSSAGVIIGTVTLTKI